MNQDIQFIYPTLWVKLLYISSAMFIHVYVTFNKRYQCLNTCLKILLHVLNPVKATVNVHKIHVKLIMEGQS